MTIKGDRQVNSTELRYFLNETSTPGVVVSVSTAGSGVALESTSNVATVAAASSGQKPLGILLNEFVNIDLSRQPINPHKNQANSGDKATILTDGWIVTDRVVSATAGNAAVLASSGYIMDKPTAGHDEAVNPTIGTFRTGLDEDGYASVNVNL